MRLREVCCMYGLQNTIQDDESTPNQYNFTFNLWSQKRASSNNQKLCIRVDCDRLKNQFEAVETHILLVKYCVIITTDFIRTFSTQLSCQFLVMFCVPLKCGKKSFALAFNCLLLTSIKSISSVNHRITQSPIDLQGIACRLLSGKQFSSFYWCINTPENSHHPNISIHIDLLCFHTRCMSISMIFEQWLLAAIFCGKFSLFLGKIVWA